MIDNDSFPYLEMSSSFVFGLTVGYALKKSVKILILLFGFGFLWMIFLEYQGVISIKEIQLHNFVDIGIEKLNSLYELVRNRLEKYQVAGGLSAMAGFYVGLKIA